MNFHVFKAPSQMLVLGHPWLHRHNPHVDWETGTILGWGKGCVNHCEFAPAQESFKTSLNHVPPTTDSETSDLSSMPVCYHHLREVFSKTKAMSLPPHRPYDLIPGSPIPKGHLYSVSELERAGMKDYIETSLKVGLIRLSSSAAGAGFFFVDKKDGSLRPCIE